MFPADIIYNTNLLSIPELEEVHLSKTVSIPRTAIGFLTFGILRNNGVNYPNDIASIIKKYINILENITVSFTPRENRWKLGHKPAGFYASLLFNTPITYESKLDIKFCENKNGQDETWRWNRNHYWFQIGVLGVARNRHNNKISSINSNSNNNQDIDVYQSVSNAKNSDEAFIKLKTMIETEFGNNGILDHFERKFRCGKLNSNGRYVHNELNQGIVLSRITYSYSGNMNCYLNGTQSIYNQYFGINECDLPSSDETLNEYNLDKTLITKALTKKQKLEMYTINKEKDIVSLIIDKKERTQRDINTGESIKAVSSGLCWVKNGETRVVVAPSAGRDKGFVYKDRIELDFEKYEYYYIMSVQETDNLKFRFSLHS